jgi:hypothetical protein
VGAQGDGSQPRSVCRENFLLGNRFGLRVCGQILLGVRDGLVYPLHVPTVKDNTWGAGVHQISDARLPAGLKDVSGARHIDSEEVIILSPDSGFGACVEDQITILTGPSNGVRVGEIARQLLDPEGYQPLIVSAGKTSDTMTFLNESLDNPASKETTSPGDQNLAWTGQMRVLKTHDFS